MLYRILIKKAFISKDLETTGTSINKMLVSSTNDRHLKNIFNKILPLPEKPITFISKSFLSSEKTSGIRTLLTWLFLYLKTKDATRAFAEKVVLTT